MKYAESLIKNPSERHIQTSDLVILAKYYKQIHHMKNAGITEELIEKVQQCYTQYIPGQWQKKIKYAVKYAEKTPIFQSIGIPVTTAELKTIGTVNSIRTERLLFVLLCIAKFNIQKYPNSAGYVSTPYAQLFQMAKTAVTVKQQCMMMRNLIQTGLIESSKRVDNLSIRVTFIDNKSDAKYIVDDFRELGYRYMLWKGDKIILCERCGKLIRKTNNRRRYCSACAKEENIKRTLEKYRKQNF